MHEATIAHAKSGRLPFTTAMTRRPKVGMYKKMFALYILELAHKSGLS
jgi:hypothetical protein